MGGWQYTAGFSSQALPSVSALRFMAIMANPKTSEIYYKETNFSLYVLTEKDEYCKTSSDTNRS